MATGTMKVRAVADMSQLTRAMNKTQGRVQKFAGGMKRVGGTMSKSVTPAIGGMAVMALKTASDFESSMKRVQALTGSTGKEFKGLESLAKDLGRTTQFSASEAADGMGFLAQAGFDAKEMMSALPGTLNLAAAGQLELAEAADIASNVLTGYGMEAAEIGRVNDVLAKTSTSANTDVRQLGEAFSLVAPVAKSSGLAFEETNAILGSLGDAGIQASRAGTTLRGMLAALESPSKAAAKAMDRLGLKTHDAQGELLPMADIVEQLEDKGLSTADAMEIFGRRAGPGMAALVEKGADGLRKMTGELEESGGTAKEIADKQMEGLRGAMLRFKAALEGVAIAIADSGLLEWATGLAEKIAGLLGRVAKMNPKLMKIGVIAAAVAAAIGPLLLILGGLISAASALAPVLIGVAGALSLPVVAIGALVAALVIAYTKSETFRNIVNSAFAAVRDMAMEAWPQVRDIIESVLDAVEGAIRLFVAVAEAIWRTWGKTILRFLKEIWSAVEQVIFGALKAVEGVFEVFAGLFTGDWSRMWDGIKQVFAGVWDAISGILDAAFAALRGVFSVFRKAITSVWSDLWGAVKRTVSSAFDTLVDSARSKFDTLKGVVSSGVNAVIGLINKFIGGFNSIASAVGLDISISKIGLVGGDSLHPAMHSGGIIGEDAESRQGPLRANEVPFVGLRGEEVLTRDDPRHSRNVRGQAQGRGTGKWWFTDEGSSQWHEALKQMRSASYLDQAPGWNVPWGVSQWDKAAAGLDLSMGSGDPQGRVKTVNKTRGFWEGLYGVVFEDRPNVAIVNNAYADRFGAAMRKTIAAHEVGHTLGFEHTTENSIMHESASKMASAPTGRDKSLLAKMFPPIDEGEDEGGEGIISRTIGSIRDWIADRLGPIVGNVVGSFEDLARGNPLVGLLANAGIQLAKAGIPFLSDKAPEDEGGGAGGKTLARVKEVLERFPSAKITSDYRTPEENRRVGGAPNSFHLDKSNPAVDIGGPTGVLDRIAAILRDMGGWRELLWRTSGHFDHVHVAHSGGRVTDRGIDPLPGELLAKLKSGETILPPGASIGGDGESTTRLLREIRQELRQGQTIQVDREVLGEVVREEFRRMDRDNISAGLP